jgi:two-component system response regulator HydG
VFLDEIGEMSPLGQAKILRFLENREIFPLGARRTSKIDVRFVAATNQDLEPMVQCKTFRQDLYFRLNVARIYLPRLRERPEDVPELFSHFIRIFNAQRGTNVQPPSPELADRLLAYEWPGNVRELRNCVEAVFIDPPPGPIGVDDLPEPFLKIFRSYTNKMEQETRGSRATLVAHDFVSQAREAQDRRHQ